MVSQDFLPNPGGIASHIVGLSRALVRLGHAVCVVKSGFEVGSSSVYRRDGIEVHDLKMSSRLPRGNLLANVVRTTRYLNRLTATRCIDLIHWHQSGIGGWQTKFVRRAVPKVFTNHTSMYLDAFRSPLGRLRLKVLLAHADAVIAPSRELAEKSRIINHGRPAYYIPNGVDPEEFRPEVDVRSVAADHGIPQDRPVVLCPRRLAPKNGVIYFARALPLIHAQCPRACYLIAGHGGFEEEAARVAQAVREVGVEGQVIFTGDVPHDCMPALMVLAEVVVFPSLQEATSIAGLEAMAAGRPVVATRVGGLPEIVAQGETGLLVPPRDPRALAHAVVSLLRDGPRRARYGSAARQRVMERFSWKMIAERTLHVYREVLGRRVPAATRSRSGR